MRNGPKMLHILEQTGALLIARLGERNHATSVVKAAIDGGFRVVEVPLTTPDALKIIEELNGAYTGSDETVYVGAGTVLDEHQAESCLNAGASFLVSPSLNRSMIGFANRHQVPTISGAFTPTEILDTVTSGASVVKLFPAEFFGPAYAKSVLAPLRQIRLMPSGGVRPDNVDAWYRAGAFCVAAGSYVTGAGDFADVRRAAEVFLSATNEAQRRTAGDD